jgi:type II secretory pathway pseudopilin PulG
MRILVVTLLLAVLAGSATAQEGLSGAIDRQRQDMATQQEQMRRETERQRDSLQQQQQQSLQFELLQRQVPLSQQPPLRNCAPVGGNFVCR